MDCDAPARALAEAASHSQPFVSKSDAGSVFGQAPAALASERKGGHGNKKHPTKHLILILVGRKFRKSRPFPPVLFLQELRGKLEKKLETEKAQKEMMEAKLAEAASALETAQKQLAQKGWDAADALAAVNDEMARQRSVSDERQRLLEEELMQVRRRMEDLLATNCRAAADASTSSRQKELEIQLQSKVGHVQELLGCN